MQFVEIKHKCGWPSCTVISTPEEGLVVQRLLAMDRQKPKLVDLCKTHNDELDELIGHLRDDGRSVEGGKPKKPTIAQSEPSDIKSVDDLACRVPDCPKGLEGNEPKNKAGLAQHVIRTHGFENLAAYYEEHPPSG